jgi:hypothetical protein
VSLALPSRRAVLAPPWVKNELWRRARAVPSLDQRFAESLSLIDAVSGQQLITFTRASDGTFVGSNGLIQTAGTNVPRFTHDPVTLESLGLLVEEQRTNLLLHNRTLTNAAWVATNITTAKDQTGADGVSNSASSITASAGNGTILQTITSASAARATSAYVKRITGTGTIQMTQDNGSTWTAVTVTSGWTQVTIPSATVTNPVVGFRIVTSGDAIAVDYVQCESGAFSTSAIQTTTATVTRSADVVSITGSAFSSWYRQDEGTVFADVASVYNGGRYLMFDDGSAVDRWDLRYSSFVATLNSWKSSVQEGNANTNVVGGAPSVNVKLAGANKTNDIAIASNGAAALLGVDTTSTMPTNQTRMFIGSFQGTATYTNGPIRRITYWPQRLSNTTLQALTQ